MYKKLKSFLENDAIFMALLVILVGVVSFGLGRQSARESVGVNVRVPSQAGIVFTDVLPAESGVEAVTDQEAYLVVASRSGSKYHRLDCTGAKAIKEENKIYFDSVAEAKAGGFQPAANCPDLP